MAMSHLMIYTAGELKCSGVRGNRQPAQMVQ